MALDLIPFPISIVFIVVFALAWIVILWKLRKRGKAYSVLFKASLVIGIVFSIVLLSSIEISIFG